VQIRRCADDLIIKGVGSYNGYGIAWTTRGPEASFKPTIYGTVGASWFKTDRGDYVIGN